MYSCCQVALNNFFKEIQALFVSHGQNENAKNNEKASRKSARSQRIPLLRRQPALALLRFLAAAPNSMSTPQLSPALWIRATILGWFLGFVFVVALSAIFEGLGLSEMQFHVGVAMAMGVSMAQWCVLRRRGFYLSWIWYSIAGMGLPFIAIDLFYLSSPSAVSENHLALGAGSGAVLLAVLQSVLIRKLAPLATGRWIVLSTLAWWVAAGSVMLINYTMKAIAQPLLGFFVNLFLILIGGPLLGLLTSGLITRVVNRDPVVA
jgi:hypothetical protein